MSFTSPIRYRDDRGPSLPGWYETSRDALYWWNGSVWKTPNPDVLWPDRKPSYGSFARQGLGMVIVGFGVVFFVGAFWPPAFLIGVALIVAGMAMLAGPRINLNRKSGRQAWTSPWPPTTRKAGDQALRDALPKCSGDVELTLMAETPMMVRTVASMLAPPLLRKTLAAPDPFGRPFRPAGSTSEQGLMTRDGEVCVFLSVAQESLAGAPGPVEGVLGFPRWVGFARLAGQYALPTLIITPQNSFTRVADLLTPVDRTSDWNEYDKQKATDTGFENNPILEPHVLAILMEPECAHYGFFVDGDALVVVSVQEHTDIPHLFDTVRRLRDAIPNYLYA